MWMLVGHPVLDGDAAAERSDAVDGVRRDRLGMVDEPVQALERDVTVHLFEDVERAADGLLAWQRPSHTNEPNLSPVIPEAEAPQGPKLSGTS
jgi:hypothetical protein